MPRTLFHVTPVENLARILEQGLKPQIGPRSEDLGETTPGIYAFADLMDLDGAEWLADAFDEDTVLAVLELQVPTNARCHEGAGFEVVLADPVPPASCRVVCHDLDDPKAYAQLMSGAWPSSAALPTPPAGKPR